MQKYSKNAVVLLYIANSVVDFRNKILRINDFITIFVRKRIEYVTVESDHHDPGGAIRRRRVRFLLFSNHACRCESGALLFCRNGHATAGVNQIQGEVRRNTLIVLLPGWVLTLNDRSEDFRASFCAFSRDLFAEAAFRLDPSFSASWA